LRLNAPDVGELINITAEVAEDRGRVREHLAHYVDDDARCHPPCPIR
jgi:hypothetical protein